MWGGGGGGGARSTKLSRYSCSVFLMISCLFSDVHFLLHSLFACQCIRLHVPTIANILDPDQARPGVGRALGPIFWTR